MLARDKRTISDTLRRKMQKKPFIFLTITFLIALSHSSFTQSTPVLPFRSTKSSLCPHGVHYIDSCKNACSCDPRYGGAMCTRMTDCDEGKGVCPLGESYKDPLWGANFQCYCNNDKSQTYECFDCYLSAQNTYYLASRTRVKEWQDEK